MVKKLPFWLNPRQIGIVSLADEKYTEKVKDYFKSFRCEVLRDNNTINKNLKILINKAYYFVCVIGNKEAEKNTINVRINNNQIEYSLDDFKSILSKLEEDKKEYEDLSKEFSNLKI